MKSDVGATREKCLESDIEFSTASPPMGLLLTKPAEVMLFFTDPDTRDPGIIRNALLRQG